MSEEIPVLSGENPAASEEIAVNTTKLYMLVGVVCGIGMLLIIANGTQSGAGTNTKIANPHIATPHNLPPNPFQQGLPKLPSAGGDIERVSTAVAEGAEVVRDGAKAVSGVVQNGAAVVNQGMNWIQGTLSPDATEHHQNEK